MFTTLPDGRVLTTLDGIYTTDAPYLYNPATNSWSNTSSYGQQIGG